MQAWKFSYTDFTPDFGNVYKQKPNTVCLILSFSRDTNEQNWVIHYATRSYLGKQRRKTAYL